MRNISSIIQESTKIYGRRKADAENYLKKVRAIESRLGPGTAIMYSWFYSIPQKWTQVEPIVFKMMNQTEFFDLNTILSTPINKTAAMLKSLVFSNQISIQLHNFCYAIKEFYSSWENFKNILRNKTIFEIFNEMKRKRNIRVTFKNLAAMKAFVGLDDNLLILDTHVAKIMNIKQNEIKNFRTNETLFKDLLKIFGKITSLISKKYPEVTMIKLSLAIWFNGARITAGELLNI